MLGILKLIFGATFMFFVAPPLLALAIPILAVTAFVALLVVCGWFLYTIFANVMDF